MVTGVVNSALVSMPPRGIAVLAGYTVAVASDRRRATLADDLEHRGARAVSVQASRAIATPDDTVLRAATLRCLAAPIDDLVVTSNFGLTAWLRAARRWQLSGDLLAHLDGARLLASNAHAADALRDTGLGPIWSTAAGTAEELFHYLLAHPLTGRRVAVQCDGPGLIEMCHALRRAGADVTEVPTYRDLPPAHADLLRRMAEQIVNAQVDAVVFTAPGAVRNLIAQARMDARAQEMLNALAGDVLAICPGPLTSEPLRALGVTALTTARPYTEEVLDMVGVAVARRAVRLRVQGSDMEVRGQAVVLNNRLLTVQPGPIGVLRALARHPGQVLSCAEIRHETPSWTAIDDHAIEMAVSRLRRSLDDTDMIQTVVKRGYRLAI